MRQKLMTKVNLNHNIGSSAPDAKSPREREISSDNKVDSLESVNTKHPYLTSQSDKNEQFNIEQTLSDAEEAIDTATAERSEQNFNMAIEAYEQALTHYQTAINGIENRSSERDKKIEEAIEKTHEDLQAVKEVKKRKSEAIEALEPAERSLQEAIVAYIEGNQTVARVRFQQARDSFRDALEIIENSNKNAFESSVIVSVEPKRKFSSTALSEVELIPTAAVTILSDQGIDTIGDLDCINKPIEKENTVGELIAAGVIDASTGTTLTLLSWWHNGTYTFETIEDVKQRQQQADYGFNHSS
jgi:tetratricopeptide (TPR) repeat protein